MASLGALLMASSVKQLVPPRMGNRSEDAAPQGCYRCLGDDQWCAVSVRTDEQWQALVALLPGYLEPPDERFACLQGRLAHHDAIDAAIERWTVQLPDVEVEKKLTQAGVPAQRMRRAKDFLADPESQRVFESIEDPPGHWPLMPKLPIAYSRSRVTQLSRSPHIGEHTSDILQEWLGLSTTQVAELENEGALV